MTFFQFLRDPVSALSHLIMALVVALITTLLYRFTPREFTKRIGIIVFGVCSTLLYLISGLYHAASSPESAIETLRRCDLSAIFVMIAGCYTPVMLVLLTGNLRRVCLLLVWSIAIGGIGLVCLSEQIATIHVVGLYVIQVFTGFTGVRGYFIAIGWQGLKWPMLEAIIYGFGAWCDVNKWPNVVPGLIQSHEVLHFCDIAGTLTHVIFLVKYVIPYRD